MAQKKNSVKRKKHSATIPTWAIVVAIIVAILCATGGVITAKAVTKNDKFVLLGEKEVNLKINDEYVEEGAEAVSFGKNVTKKITIKGEVDTKKAGVYYIVYGCDDVKYRDFFRVRKVVVSEG